MRKIWTKESLPEMDPLAQSLRDAKLFATDLLMEGVQVEVAFKENLPNFLHNQGTARALRQAYRRWYKSQVSEKPYVPYIPNEQAVFTQLEEFITSKADSGKEQLIPLIKRQFYEELKYGLELHGFSLPIPMEVKSFLFEGWERAGRHVDWFQLVTLRFGEVLADPANKKARLAFNRTLLADIRTDTRFISIGIKEVLELLRTQEGLAGLMENRLSSIEEGMQNLSRAVCGVLPENILRESPEVMTLIQRTVGLKGMARAKWQEFDRWEKIAASHPCEANIEAKIRAKIAWQETAAELESAEIELAGLEQYIKSTADIFSRIDMEAASARLKEARQRFEAGHFAGVRELLASGKRGVERTELLAKEEEIQQRKQAFAEEDLIYAKTILVDFENPNRFTEATYEFVRSLEMFEYFDNCFQYACFLQDQYQHKEAIALYERALSYPYEAGGLLEGHVRNSLGNLYREMQRYDESEESIKAALSIYRNFVKVNPTEFEPYLARCFHNLGVLYRQLHRYSQSEASFKESLEIYIRVGEIGVKFARDFANVLINLGNLYRHLQNYEQAETYLLAGLEVRRFLSKELPGIFEGDLAGTLVALVNLYLETKRYEESETNAKEALGIYRRWCEINPAAFQPCLAVTLVDVGILYEIMQRWGESEACHLEAIAVYRKLTEDNPAAYESNLGAALYNLGALYKAMEQYGKSETYYLEALIIFRKLSERSPDAFESWLAGNLQSLGLLSDEAKKYQEAEKYFVEAVVVFTRRYRSCPDTYLKDLTVQYLVLIHLLLLPEVSKEATARHFLRDLAILLLPHKDEALLQKELAFADKYLRQLGSSIEDALKEAEALIHQNDRG
ncbi:hypothetical protein GCM10011511_55880 [Puia dinghuensis]|uniref:Tetratricopeptide repeat protein n=2 Tax=Puia dinghuensis TaxID=1792502 RepID=A0A8J2UJB1_9BACT|nr:hypothetical protein GCM10011511_55880 [Puia dinghuensis]